MQEIKTDLKNIKYTETLSLLPKYTILQANILFYNSFLLLTK